MELTELATPSLLIDLDVMEKNIQRMSRKAGRLGVGLRPHVKTHKSVEIARLQTRGAKDGITVSTLAEAEYFASAGFTDITYAVPLTPNKMERACRLAEGMDRLAVLLDHGFDPRLLSDAAEKHGRPISVFLKVDCGYHRFPIAGFQGDPDPCRPLLSLS